AAIPLTGAGTADRAIQANVRRQDASVLAHAITPSVDILEDPCAILLLASKQERIKPQSRGDQVLWVIADYIRVIVKVSQHFLISTLAVVKIEPTFNLDRVSGPVKRRCLAKQRPAAAVDQAADDSMLRVIVGRGRVVAVVESGISYGPAL